MKKVISLLLSAVLLATALFTAMPISAETDAETLPVTPLVDYNINAPFWQVVGTQSVIPETTKKFVIANGIKITSSTGSAQTFDTAASGQILASAVYNEGDAASELPSGFAESGSFIIYVKTASANQMYLLVRTECSSMYYSSNVLADNAPYEYLSVDGTAWESGTAAGQSITFDSAFEGYVRVPASSFVNLDGVDMAFLHVSQISTYFKSIGGEYGDINVGPYFVTSSTSKATKFEVPEKYQPAPIELVPVTGYVKGENWWEKVSHDYVEPDATKKFVANAKGVEMKSVSGNALTYDTASGSEILAGANFTEAEPYQLPTGFAQSGLFVVYVKTDGANDMYFSVRTTYGENWLTTGELAQNAVYEYLPIGGSEWIGATANGNIISFASAFEGYIKIPVTSLYAAKDKVSMTFVSLSQISASFKNIGGEYGNIIAGPFFTTTNDSSSVKLEVPEEYKPAPLDISSFDLGEVRAAGYNFSALNIENTNNYDLTIDEVVWPEEGSVDQDEGKKDNLGNNVWSYVENDAGIEGADSDACLLMNPAINTYMKDAGGLVFYAEFPVANMFSPGLTFNNDPNASMTLKPGATVQVLANGSDEWVDMPVEEGFTGNTVIYGVVKFNTAFSGYIKVPFASLNNDGGFRPTLTGDNMSALTGMAVRFKGVGDNAKYGEHITFGMTGYYTTDTARPEIGTVATPGYPAGDANYDWKVNTDDLTAICRTLLGYKATTGYEVDLLELVRVKKILAQAA